MNRQVKRISLIALVMIVALMISTTLIQSINAQELNDNGYNTRAIYKEFGKPRGAILVGDTKVAESIESDDSFEYQRVYADSDVFSSVTGFFSIANRADRGLEAAVNDDLNGDSNIMFRQKLLDVFTRTKPQGADIQTTIDETAQRAAYDALDGRKGAVIALEPSTGKILAMVSTPGFDANKLAVHDTAQASEEYSSLANSPEDPLINRTSTSLYPPGSTFKVIVSAAAFETGKYTPETVVPAPVNYQLPGTDVNLPNYAGGNCNARGGQESIKSALAVSCNTAFAMLGVELGKEKVAEQAKRFGVGDTFAFAGTGGYTFESSRTKFPENLTDDRLALASIGQGDVMFTPLQDALISAAVANNGVIMQPMLVNSLKRSDGEIISSYDPKKYGEAVSPETADMLKEMMIYNVTNGVASNAGVRGVQVAGKTGTAETAEGVNPHAWFTGFAPANNPQIAISVIIENGETGGGAAAPVASKVIQQYLNGGVR